MDRYICLQPLQKHPGEAVDQDILDRLCRDLPDVFGLDCAIAPLLELPDLAYYPLRDQYLASDILLELKGQRYPGAERILAVTSEDIYAEGLNFIFGQAELSGRFGIISTRRLRGTTRAGDGRLFYRRVLKEATHELGHTFGLTHCPNRPCIMHFSNTLEDTDLKGPGFCGDCGIKLAHKMLKLVHK